jgi:phosphoenolpyruvate carboxylase
MNRFYLFIPVVLLSLFGGAYWQYRIHSDAEAQSRMEAAAASEMAAKTRQSAFEDSAREESARRAADRIEQAQNKREAFSVQWSAESARIAAETEGYQAQIILLRTELAGIGQQLMEMRKSTALVTALNFELSREVELKRIAKRNAELEVQRTTEILARRAAQTIKKGGL